MAENEFKISLGVELDTGDIKSQISQAESKLDPITIKIDTETKELTSTIKDALKDLSNGTKNALTLDTTKLEGSLKDVKGDITEIRNLLKSIGDGTGIKGITSSINQISTALDKASNKFDEFAADLKALGNKDFSVNLDIKLGGSNSVANNIDYGNKVRNDIIPKLRQQVASLVKEYNKKTGNSFSDEHEAILSLVNGTKFSTPDFLNAYITRSQKSLYARMENGEKPKEQMLAFKEFIDTFQEAANIKGIDLSSAASGFSETANELIEGAQRIQTGAKQAEDSVESLKQIFGSGINVESLAVQLDPIINKLEELRRTIENLSKNISFDGLTVSFNELSTTLNKLLDDFALAKNSLNASFDNSGAVKSSQQLGQKIGDTFEKSVKQSVNIDDVIDEQVLKLMNEYAISGGKSSKAFDEIRQSLIDFRNGSGDINKVTSAISNNMKIVNEAKNDYKDLAEYIKMFNASGAKVHIPDSIRQEYGDDYKSMRSQLGKGFTSGQGMDFETFIEETNSILGQTIDLSHGAEAAFGDLVNKVNSTKGSKFLTGDDLFGSGILDIGDVVANVSTSLEKIENAEEEIARTSTTAANTVVQNEERKQQAHQETSIIANSTSDAIKQMQDVMSGMRFDRSSIDAVAKDLESLGIEINKISVKDNGFNLDVTVKGIDSVGRAVTEIRRLDKASDEISPISKTFSQSFETSADAAKKLEKETAESFKKLKSIAQNMGKFDIEISGLEANGEIEKANSLKRILNDLESEFKDLYAVTEKNLSFDQLKELDQIFANTTGEVREFKNELDKSVKAKELASGLERLKSITKEIAQLNIDLFKFEDTDNIERTSTRLNELKNEATELRAELQRKFPTASFDEIDDIAKKGADALSKLADKAAEVRAKLAQDIKFDIEAGNFDNDISKMKNNFNNLSNASKELRDSVEQVERAYREMEQAAGLNGDEVVDIERLVKAQEDYARALEKTNNLIRIQAREEKAKADAQKLVDDQQVFQSKIDTWLKKNSAATKQFGNAMLKLRTIAENCDRVTLNHLEKQFVKLDKAADKAGLKMESFGDRIKNKLKEYSAYLSVAEVFMYAEQALRDMFEQVKLIDTAMTELKKVTNETNASYNNFLKNAASRAKEIGTTIDGLVSSTADFARLGYGFEDAQGLAEVANIYAVVGDEIDGVEGATQSLISTIAAFKDEMNGLSNSDFALSIVDKLNEVANNYSISSGGLGEALQRSASSMQAANNTLDETIALITAANEVTQSPETVGNAFKTISMRIRGAKTELEEAGESTEGMAESTALLREEIMALSGVDIMLNPNTFKSTYQILDELSQKWEGLSDIAQASIIELVAGKHRGNVMASLMTNFDTARAALETSLNSSGSAMKEHEKWSQSLEARLLKLKAAWQGFAQTFMNSNFLKGGIDFLIKLVDFLDKLIDKFGILGTIGLGTAGFGLFKLIKGDAAETVESIADVVKAIENLTDIVTNTARVADAAGDVTEVVDSVADTVSGVTNITGESAKTIANVAEAAGDGAEAMTDLGGAVTKTTGGFKAFIKTPIGVASAIGVFVAAIGLAISAYKNYKEAQSEARQETIRTSDEFLDAAGSFEQAYIKYSGRTNLTSEEEAELEAAINGTVDALGDKSSALQNVVNSSNDYVTSLEAIADAEIKAANTAAKAKRDAARKELEETVSGWFDVDGSEVDVKVASGVSPNSEEVAKIAKEIGEKYYATLSTSGSGTTQTVGFELSADADINEILDYYHTLLEYQEKLSDAKLSDTSAYDNVTSAIEKMSDAVKIYTDGVYDAVKAEYQLSEGIPKTTEEYIKMREAILGHDDIKNSSLDTKKTIANTLDSEYGKMFDLSSAEVQARKLIGVLDEYGDNEAGQMETFLNMRTAVNNDECTVGEYMSQFDDINKMTKDWSDEAKEELNTSFGLDTDGIKQQYEEMQKYLSRLYRNKDTRNMSRDEEYDYKFKAKEYDKEVKAFLDSLTASELSAFVSIKTEIDWENTSKKEILNQIKKEAEFLEAMNYTIAIDVETESVDALNSAMAESVSATGLSSESIAALKGRYAELASQGYDLSSMFEETSNGIHLNKNAVDELEQAYASSKLSETDSQLDVLKDRYDELTDKIKNCTDAGERASLYTEQQQVAQKINDLATLAAQYEGLTSAYNAWQSAESSGSERDMYENIISGFETVGDEIKRGWYDDSTIKFLELITGETDLATKSATELKEIWNNLDDTIKGTSYSIKDFFTVDEDGNSTSTGAYNFLRAIEQLGKNGTLKAVKDEAGNLMDIGKLVERNSKGKIVAFDFNVVGGDEAVAEALGVSEEMVQIIQRALDDAGFVVTLDGKYTLLSDLKTSAEEANNTLKKLKSEGLDELKGFKNEDLTFDFDANNLEALNGELEKANNVLDKFRNKDGTINLEMEGAQEALDIAIYFTSVIDKLTEPAYMQLETNQVEEALQEPLEKMQEFENLVKEKHQLKLVGDTAGVEKTEQKMSEIAKYLEELDKETQIKLGIDGLTQEEIKNKLEKGEIEIPATVDIQLEMSDDIRDMRLMMMRELGLVSDNEVKLKIGYEIDDSTVDRLIKDGKETVVLEFITKNEEWFNKLTDEKKKIVIDIISNGVDLNSLDEDKKEIVIEYVTKNKEKIDQLSDADKKVFVNYIANGGDVDKFDAELEKRNRSIEIVAEAHGIEDIESLKSAMSSLTDEQVKAIAEAIGKGDVDALNSAVEGMDGNIVKAIAQALGYSDVEALKSSISGMQGKEVPASVNTDGQSAKIDTLQSSIFGLKGTTVDVVVNFIKSGFNAVKNWLTGGGGDDEGGSGVNGTANTSGSSFANGTFGRAFVRGDWRTKKTQRALVGEIGREIVVTPNNQWYTVGDSGAEFANIPKGSIIFNHRQTEELLKNGKVTSGGGRAKALMSGTAFAQGTAFSSGTGGGEEPEATSYVVGTNKVTGEKYTKSTDDAKDEFEELFDLIEIAISRIERDIDNLDRTANNVYKSWGERSKALTNQIGKVREEINLQQKAYNEYMKAAAGVGLNSSWIKKIQDGTLDITTVTDETLAEKIKDYQKWYEAALDAKDAIEELKETEAELYQQRFDNVATQYEGMLSIIEHEKNMLDEYINQSEAQGWLVSEKYYEALASNERENIAKLQQEKAALTAELNNAVDSGKIVKNSEAWVEMVNQIDDVTLAIEESNTALLEYAQTIQQLKWEQFDLLQDRISAITEESEFLIELMSNKKLYGDDGKLTDDGMATIGLHGVNYNVLMRQADMAREEAERIKAEMASDPFDTELEARYREMIALQQEYILAAEDEKNAIRDMVEEGIEYELDALQERIDLYNEALESQKDLYDYQRKVKEQTEEIASLEKQIAAYQGDDSEESKKTVQELKVALEDARQDLEETEYDKYISDQQKLLDGLFLEYETILNMRLDNIDALIADMIAQINIEASSINSTITQAATDVGYDLSTEMRTIWDTSTSSINSVIAMYGDKFESAQTTTNTALNAIKSSIQSMIAQLGSMASQKAASAASSSAAVKKPASTTPSTSTKPSTPPTTQPNKSSGGDGTPKVGDKVKFVSGQYYYDSYGTKPIGSQKQGQYVYITRINEKGTHPYHISTGTKLGSGDLGWLKLNQLSGYASGKKNFLNDEVAWTQEDGLEYIIRPSDGAVLTPIARKGSVLNAQASSNLWNMTNSPAEFIRDNLSLGASVPNNSNSQVNYTQHLDKVVFSFPNVKNYDEMLVAMQKDPNFERLLTSMTIGRLAGKSSLAKGKAIR